MNAILIAILIAKLDTEVITKPNCCGMLYLYKEYIQ